MLGDGNSGGHKLKSESEEILPLKPLTFDLLARKMAIGRMNMDNGHDGQATTNHEQEWKSI
jgi:hypothetical protein